MGGRSDLLAHRGRLRVPGRHSRCLVASGGRLRDCPPMDARLKLAALRAAIAARHPPPGCLHNSDRGSPYDAAAYRQLL